MILGLLILAIFLGCCVAMLYDVDCLIEEHLEAAEDDE